MSDLPQAVEEALHALAEHYDDFSQNNRGANGYLFFAKNRLTHAPCAIKFYAGAEGETRHDEPRQLAAIRSANVLPILEARNVSDEWGYFVTRRCFDGDLDDLIAEQPSAHTAIDVALGICNGVSAIHAMKMVHRDLKPGNIVMDNGAPQIADFGSVRTLTNETGTVAASRHTILFRPPESFAASEYSFQGDLYQIGLVAYQLLGGVLSYEGEDYLSRRDWVGYKALSDDVDRSIFIDEVIRTRAVNGALLDYNSLPPWVSASAKRSLRLMTAPDPARRIRGIADVAAELTQMRAAVSNWRWYGDVAKLTTGNRVIEVRPIPDNQGIYEAHLSNNGGATFRRAPGVRPATLAEVIGRS